MTAEDPTTELLVHPECGCASQAMAFANERTHILSTEGMIRYARATTRAAAARRDRDGHPARPAQGRSRTRSSNRCARTPSAAT